MNITKTNAKKPKPKHLTITIFSKSWNKNVPVLIKID
jgi:hypothetical protein